MRQYLLALSAVVDLQRLIPGEVLAVFRDGEFSRPIRFISLSPENTVVYEEMAPDGGILTCANSKGGFLDKFSAARMQSLGVMIDLEYEAFAEYLQFVQHRGIGAQELVRFYQLYTLIFHECEAGTTA